MPEQRFLHVLFDDKFLDDAYAAFEAVVPGQSRYVWIEGDRRPQYLRKFRPERINLAAMLEKQFLAGLRGYDAVFIHYLDEHARFLIDQAPDGVNFVWLGWGGDYYHLIERLGRDLLLPRTRALRQQLGGAGVAIRLLDTLRAIPRWRHARARLRLRARRSVIAPGGPGEDALLRGIRFFAPVMPSEFALVAAAVPGFNAQPAVWSYSALTHIGAIRTTEPLGDAILVGNSATFENNHLDAFELIRGAESSRAVVAPFSYGERAYAEAVERAGRSMFGNRFRPLRTFLGPEEYAAVLQSCSVAVMNHVRQQALGTVILLLLRGMRVFLRRENPILEFFRSEGAHVWPIDDLQDALRRNLGALTAAETETNRAIVMKHYGEAALRGKTAALIRTVTDAAPGAA
jgi:hypothetical protein